MAAYRVTAGQGEERAAARWHLDALIVTWLCLARENTLNLAHRKDAQGRTHLIFIPRIDVAETALPAARSAAESTSKTGKNGPVRSTASPAGST